MKNKCVMICSVIVDFRRLYIANDMYASDLMLCCVRSMNLGDGGFQYCVEPRIYFILLISLPLEYYVIFDGHYCMV
jgi:hypothetical protein